MNDLIVFEGVDCSGKSTQIKLLWEKLSKKNISYSIYREPGGNSLSEKIRDILLDKSMNISNEAETMLFLAARAQLTVENIFPDLEKPNGMKVNKTRLEDVKPLNDFLHPGKRTFVVADGIRVCKAIRKYPNVYNNKFVS